MAPRDFAWSAALPTSGLEGADQPSTENDLPLSFEVLSKLGIEKLGKSPRSGFRRLPGMFITGTKTRESEFFRLTTRRSSPADSLRKAAFFSSLCVGRAGISTFSRFELAIAM